MSDDGVYLRRVKDPNPIFVELARQVCDLLDDLTRRRHGSPREVEPDVVALEARRAGVPIAYVLDERERRVRERR